MPLFNIKTKILITLFAINGVCYAQQNITDATVKKFAKEVYGDIKEYQNSEALKDYKNYLKRVEILNENSIELKNFKPENIKLLSIIRLKNKYTNISYDNYTNFNPKKFNALKYAFNFNSNQDQIFQINGTKNYVLIKAKK